MATCNDCLHEELCMSRTDTTPFTKTEYRDLDNVENFCENFKNKADFMEVVRCKDCKHSREQDRVFGITDYKCSKHNISCLSPYDFCSYGERSDT